VRPRRSSAVRGALVAAALVGLGPPTAVRAAEPDREGKITLAVRDCPEAFEVSLRRILVIELGDLLEEGDGGGAPETEIIEIACGAENASIAARNPRGEVVHNDVRFDAFPGDAAPRAVALAALEALRAVDPTLSDRLVARQAKATHARAKPVPSPPPAKSRAAAPKASRPVVLPDGKARGFTRVAVGGIARLFLGDPRTFSAGGRVEVSRRFVSAWDAGLDVDVGFSRRRVELGAVEASLLSTALWLGARGGGPAWSVTGALGGRLGLARLTGAPNRSETRGHRVTRPWAGPVLVVRTDGAIGLLALAVLLEGGFAAVGAEGLAAGAPALGFQGAWSSVSANAGIRF
jgi:hypothetical protein